MVKTTKKATKTPSPKKTVKKAVKAEVKPIEEKVEKKTKTLPLKIVYTTSDKELVEITDDKPESRQGLFPVQASAYKPGAVSYKITGEDIKNYPQLKGVALSGDIVEKEEFNKFIS